MDEFGGWKCVLSSSITTAQDEPSHPTVNTTGFNPDDGAPEEEKKSWLEQHGRFAFIIVIGLLILGLLIWYVARSVKGMRKRLQTENDNQMQMINQITAGQQQDSNQHNPQQPSSTYPSPIKKNEEQLNYQQTNTSTSPVTPTSPPPRY
ncbi:hypothetical protein BDA99DRAFT_577184 [Phascolomyces articulosus]|uniref:Uncharacterized protein n=1 Tax=Phascolomyces articulosus TaxID=60185 RepID=A0AAD5JM45_9FUNG|nr:hypothetical protein BDA99DRAFT_577184 [Phascolomyces articulosus]